MKQEPTESGLHRAAPSLGRFTCPKKSFPGGCKAARLRPAEPKKVPCPLRFPASAPACQTPVPGCSSMARVLRQELLVRVFRLAQRYKVLPCFALFNRGIHGDGGEPGGEARISSELTQLTKGLHEGVPHGFFGVLGIAEDRHSHTKHPSPMPPHQCFKRAPVSAEDAIRGLQIVFLPHRLFWRFAALYAHDI